MQSSTLGVLVGIGDVLFGGLNASTNPNDYHVGNPQQAGLNGLMGQSSAQVDPSQQQQFRQMQMAQAQRLQQIASGQAQGAGELAAQRQVQQAIAGQQGMAHMARGGQNAALAFRGAANNAAGIGLQGAGVAQQAAMQDQSNAQGLLTGALNQGRGQDIGMASTNAQLAQTQYGQNLNAYTQLNAQQLQAQNAAMQAATGQQGIMGGLVNTAGTVTAAALSDERAKTEIRDGGGDIDEMLDKLVAKSYRYKNEAKHGAGERAGIMTQDLARSKAGSQMLVNLPDGLGFDVSKAVSAALASTARLNERMRKLEGKRG